MKELSLKEQNKEFISIIKQNKELMLILDYLYELKIPNFYIAAGSIYQTIWNYYDNKPLNDNIKDIDIIYYDSNHLSKEEEMALETNIINHFTKLNIKYDFDIHNEARMHLWKKENENPGIDYYKNSEDAIDKWIATVQAVGITKLNNEIKVYAPYGLKDIFNRTIRPINNQYNSKENYKKKVNSWNNRFKDLTIISWE